MLTLERQVKNKPTIIELKSATNSKQKQDVLQRLGGNIQGCIARLKNLIVEIQSETNLRKIAEKMSQYQKVNKEFNKLQDSLAQIQDDTPVFQKILQMNKQFIETYHPEELKKKLNHMADERKDNIKHEKMNQMNFVNQNDALQETLLYEGKSVVQRRILEQEKAELVEIERLITQINEIADQTKIKLNEIGVVIKIGLEKMSSAEANLKDGRQNLKQTNEYQQDTNKKFLIFCCLTVVIVSIIVLIIFSSNNKTE